MNKPNHSPLPWYISPTTEGKHILKLKDRNGEVISTLKQEAPDINGIFIKEDAEFIKTACNNHYTAFELLKRAQEIARGLVDHEAVEMCAIAELELDIADFLEGAK